jgi:hypothetical protein
VDLPVFVVPLGPVHPEGVAVEFELGRRAVVVLRVAEQHERMAAQEDEPAARPQHPSRLRDPRVRVAPDRGTVLGEREVEALVAERRPLAVAVDEREPQVELPWNALAVTSCQLELSSPTGRAPRLASHADQ